MMLRGILPFDLLMGVGIGTVIVSIHLIIVFTPKAAEKKFAKHFTEAEMKSMIEAELKDPEVEKRRLYPLWLRIILIYIASIIFQLMQGFPFSLFPSLSPDSTLLITSLSSLPILIIFILALVKIFRGKKG